MPDATDEPVEDVTKLVEDNGLVKLFANRVRARIVVTLFYADDPLTTGELADAAGISEAAVGEALDPMSRFELFERTDGNDGETRYRLDEDDELVDAIRTVAELATERYYDNLA